MEYDGYVIGPVIRQLRKNRNLTLEQVSEKTGLSVSSIKQLEQGGRNLSMRTLYLFMGAFQCDANTLLHIENKGTDKMSIDRKLELLPSGQKEYFLQAFIFMLDQVGALVS